MIDFRFILLGVVIALFLYYNRKGAFPEDISLWGMRITYVVGAIWLLDLLALIWKLLKLFL
jgi:hypothetical protein